MDCSKVAHVILAETKYQLGKISTNLIKEKESRKAQGEIFLFWNFVQNLSFFFCSSVLRFLEKISRSYRKISANLIRGIEIHNSRWVFYWLRWHMIFACCCFYCSFYAVCVCVWTNERQVERCKTLKFRFSFIFCFLFAHTVLLSLLRVAHLVLRYSNNNNNISNHFIFLLHFG